jgi:transcriptional regulator with XRE-family HTH domain
MKAGMLGSADAGDKMTGTAGSGTTTFEGDAGELGAFLRRMRERASPQSLGLAVSRRRRAPGLLREEVAQAAGISATWYTWLEQGRRVRASVEVLDALARALSLDATERHHLLALARPDLQRSFEPAADASLEALARWIASLPQPAYAFDERWNVLACNDAARRLFGDFAADDPVQGNLLRRIFLDPTWRTLLEDWEQVARASAGQFRHFNSARLGEPTIAALVDEMRRSSPDFARLWDEGGVAPPAMRQKLLRHPTRGMLSFEFVVLRPEGTPPGVRVSLYSAADAHTARQLGDTTEGAEP